MSTLQDARPAAGWYPDPSDPQRERWWDGTAWTTRISAPSRPRRRAAALGWVLAGSAILAVVVAMLLSSGLPAQWVAPGGPLAPEVMPLPSVPSRASAAAQDLPAALDGSVSVQADCGPGCGALGGAVAISKDELLTAAHVVVEGATVLVVGPRGEAMLARVLDTDPTADLALLQTAAPHGLPIVALRAEPPVIGEPVHAVGMPEGARRVSDGTVTKILDLEGDGVTEVQTDADIDLGNSGGPLLDDSGRLLGIVVKEHELDDSIGWATSGADIAKFLATAVRSGQAPASGQPLPGSQEYNSMLRDLFRDAQQD